MKSYENRTGVTLIEMLIVVAIIVILTTMVVGIAGRIDNQSKEQLTKSTFGILTAALRQFGDYKYNYMPPYSEFDFPLDCAFFNDGGLETTLRIALGASTAVISSGAPDPTFSFSSGEAMYFFLSQVPECRKTLDRIDESLITNLGFDQQPRIITITYPSGVPKVYPLFRIIDPWGTTLQYKYYDNTFLDPRSKLTFPVITSAGPDKKFGPGDDISSRK
ncbi:MAG: type II secretion system protein [Planctomycetes bacterium]|nr:type II secretion system protein [Planctomycetota bacterium]